jgi:hypothetical protein
MDLKETKWEAVDSIHVAQNTDKLRAVVKTVMNL